MGVKDLWSILEPCSQRQTLDELKGLTVAVDLGFWACQLSAAVQNPNVPKPYLKNLFFRICALLRRNIKPIFVNEGEPPEIKRETIKNRQNARFGRNKNQNEKLNKPEKLIKRKKFGACLKECCELIQLMGLPVVESDGEAEAYCAALNSTGIVDGVITDDGDALLYGALCVYRNFNLDGKVPTFDCYRMESIEKSLNLNRKKLVALSLLLGCDYCPKGVPGVGKENALKFFETLDDEVDVLIRIQNWSLNNDQTSCSKSEAFIKARAMKMTDFPNQDVINEYLRQRNVPDNMTKEDILWRQPFLTPLHPFLSSKLDWPDDYIVAKVVPLIVLWNFRNTDSSDCSPKIVAQKILKQRTKDKTPVYEVQWEKLAADIWTEKEFYVTIENKNVIDNRFPDLVIEFEESLKKPSIKKAKVSRKTNKKLTKSAADTDSVAVLICDDNEEFENISFAVGTKNGDVESLTENLQDEWGKNKENNEIESLADQLRDVAHISETGIIVGDVNIKDAPLKIDDDILLNVQSPLPLAKRLQLLLPNGKNSVLLKDKNT